MYKCNILFTLLFILEWDKKDDYFQKAKTKPSLNKGKIIMQYILIY